MITLPPANLFSTTRRYRSLIPLAAVTNGNGNGSGVRLGSPTLRFHVLLPTDIHVDPEQIGASARQAWADAMGWIERASGTRLRWDLDVYYSYGSWTTQEIHEIGDQTQYYPIAGYRVTYDQYKLLSFISNNFYGGGYSNLTGDTTMYFVFEYGGNPFANPTSGYGIIGTLHTAAIFPKSYLKYPPPPEDDYPYDTGVGAIIHELCHAAFNFGHEGEGSIMTPSAYLFDLHANPGQAFTDQQAFAITQSPYAIGQTARTVFIGSPPSAPVVSPAPAPTSQPAPAPTSQPDLFALFALLLPTTPKEGPPFPRALSIRWPEPLLSLFSQAQV